MNLLNEYILQEIGIRIIHPLLEKSYDSSLNWISKIQTELYQNIPDRKRISYGRFYTIKVLSRHIFSRLTVLNAPAFDISTKLFEKSSDYITRGVALGILSFCGLDNFECILPYFETAANADHWETRESAAAFFSKLIKKYPEKAQKYFLNLVKSDNPNLRRFAGESLRPVNENRCLYNNPDYTLSILKHLFRESAPYPRTSVGNNLSDLAKRYPEMVYDLVKELVDSGNKDSYWIAYRACRNLVKQEPIRVMDILKVDKYKQRIHRRRDYQRN